LARPKKRMYDGRGSHSFTLLGISALAMLITGLGISGLISFTVNQRRKQIGIRRALGGTKRQIVNFFIIEISLLTAMGAILGVVLTFGLNYLMSDQSGTQSGLNWLPLVSLIAAIWAVNLIASWLPAKRASLIEPAIVTRAG
jgi:putative ABC transport system permease protein